MKKQIEEQMVCANSAITATRLEAALTFLSSKGIQQTLEDVLESGHVPTRDWWITKLDRDIQYLQDREMPHTPTPWVAFHDHPDPETAAGLGYIRPVGSSRNDLSIASVYACETPRQKANLGFIIRACNAHDSLVAALMIAQRYLKSVEHGDAPCMDRIDAALLQAGTS
ncbi:hypothetical protein [Glaciimonas sp. PAMC28666]|uniref:hypothetical protein n=1 Tax=Glaciimonas sp. PAMC28666 TaxID=2807626 RepID=UPI001962C111|nr:hypothetical protein [Glaciimonas sp. PAMC28666]QRX82224.1 hypothetical protein JQN73_19360 [Glaciimonas sp. PAMC28666]